ncbi:CPXCG motif-containing cysteine-rich protein [Winogradskyella eckloniae]|uniref:CPXCG motif-containing cysteine-rich protein n=1 Tax=Winogradskyella eckloniae TaxID=1089306 RepID=UPI00156726B4|nr:CPXCG motif-containing cysteine-rich protein [Winogradskyella eckloniae]NRD19505.1 CPXCG motif-containing cysteine-rich protein [Winogradskyella eckloniae]
MKNVKYFFQCPYCWEQISMLFDTSQTNQKYIEDCEICCNPIQVSVRSSAHKI